jgi:hypothetical protein
MGTLAANAKKNVIHKMFCSVVEKEKVNKTS